MRHCGDAIFSGSGRDIESLGLGVVHPAPGLTRPPEELAADTAQQVLVSSLRLLALNRYFVGRRDGRAEDSNAPEPLQRWLSAVEDLHEVDRGVLHNWARNELPHGGQVAQRWLVRLDQCIVSPPSDALWECPRCRWRHMHASAGVCTKCRSSLLLDAEVSPHDVEDYYRTLAQSGAPIRRLDKLVYRSIGVVDCYPSRGQVDFFRDPFGEMRVVGLCERCKNVEDHPGTACSNCGANDGSEFRYVQLAKPAGFRTEWLDGTAYEGSRERLSRASPPRLVVDRRAMPIDHDDHGLAVRAGQTQLYTINDNRGHGFRFQRSSQPTGGWLALGSFDGVPPVSWTPCD